MRADEDVLREILREGRLAPVGFMVAFNEFVVAHVPDHPVAIRKTILAYNELLEYIPQGYLISFDELQREANAGYAPAALSVPLYEILTDVGEAIYNFVGTFFHQEIRDAGLFQELRKQATQNENIASGMTNADRVLGRKEVINAYEYDAEPAELIRIYLRHTPFYDLFHAQVAFRIPRDRWPTHALVLGPSEWGKSELTGLFMREALEDPEPRAVILCDPHGDLYQKALPRVSPERLVAIDLTRNPPDLNILDHGTTPERDALQTFRFLVSSLAGGLTPKQEGCIRPLFSLLKEIEGATLITLHEIIAEQTRKPKRFAEEISRLNSLHRSFFESLWYSGEYSDTRQALQWKVTATIDDPTFYRMFSAKHNSIQVSRWIQERKVVLIKSSDQLDKQGTQLFFLYILGQYYAAAKRRDALPQSRRHLTQLFFDEASVVLQSPIIADILTEIRKYNCSFVAASQLWEHVAKEVRPAILGSCGIRILGQLGHDEASALYRDQRVSLETITGLKAVPRAYAQWCFFIRSVTEKGAVVKTPYGVLEEMPKQRQPDSLDPVTEYPWKHHHMHQAPPPQTSSLHVTEHGAAPEDPFAPHQDGYYKQMEEGKPDETSTDDDHIRPARE
jgi:hypothetical protein